MDPARLVFARHRPNPEYLALYRHADLFLDTWPYNAHTTASDALWAGCPVLTTLGGTFAGRVAASLLHAVGLPELVAPTIDAYVARAIALAGNRAELARLRAYLLAAGTRERAVRHAAHDVGAGDGVRRDGRAAPRRRARVVPGWGEVTGAPARKGQTPWRATLRVCGCEGSDPSDLIRLRSEYAAAAQVRPTIAAAAPAMPDSDTGCATRKR